MSQQLPVPIRNQQPDRSIAVAGQQGSASSTLARMAIALAPDILRATERIVLKRDQPAPAPRQHQQAVHGQAFQVSEVEIDTSIPFVRRVTVRNAASWSTFAEPDPVPVVESKRSRGKLIGLSGAVALVAAVMVRKAIPGGKIIDVTGRQRD